MRTKTRGKPFPNETTTTTERFPFYSFFLGLFFRVSWRTFDRNRADAWPLSSLRLRLLMGDSKTPFLFLFRFVFFFGVFFLFEIRSLVNWSGFNFFPSFFFHSTEGGGGWGGGGVKSRWTPKKVKIYLKIALASFFLSFSISRIWKKKCSGSSTWTRFGCRKLGKTQ